jgi:hypothetical protein
MAKKTKGFLPKRVAGVKVPKSVRKGRLGELLSSKTGQILIAEAIMAASAVGAAKKAKDSPAARKAVRDVIDKVHLTGDGAARDVGSAGATLAYALGEAARSFADALHRGPDRAAAPLPADAAWAPDYGAPTPEPKKKRTPSEAGPN